jgi:hypothetical protein
MVSADRLDGSISLSCTDSAGSAQKNTNGVRSLLFVYQVFTICLRQLLDCAALREELLNTERQHCEQIVRGCAVAAIVAWWAYGCSGTPNFAGCISPVDVFIRQQNSGGNSR